MVAIDRGESAALGARGDSVGRGGLGTFWRSCDRDLSDRVGCSDCGDW